MNETEENYRLQTVARGKRYQKRFRLFLLSVGSFTFLAYMLMEPAVRMWRLDDLKGEPLKHAEATVITQAAPQQPLFPGDRMHPAPTIVVQFHGQLCIASKVKDWQKLRVGTKVAISYYEGHSGHIYLQLVKPLH